MGQVRKHSVEVIHQVCIDYLEGQGSYQSLAKRLSVSEFTIRSWVSMYQTHGKDVFTYKQRNRSYTKAFKEQVIHEYVQGKASIFTLSTEHDLSTKTIRKWVQVYYNGGEQKAYDPKGEVYTMKSRKTTLTERIEIVKWVIDHPMDYKGAAEQFDVPYHLVFNWVKKYLSEGEEALQFKKRGRPPKQEIQLQELSEVESLQHQLNQEIERRKLAELKLEIHKKKEELEHQLRTRK
jgi:transposase